jgi:type II secretory pathway component PulF
MMQIKAKIETGSSLSQAFREHPGHFDELYCNLVHAGETSGTIDAILDRLALYLEKILAIKSKIKSALFYPISVMVVAIVVVWVIMVWVIPAFKQVFTSFGADLPAPTLMVIAISDFVVVWWWAIFIALVGSIVAMLTLYRRSAAFRLTFDRLLLKFRWSARSCRRRRSPAGRARSRRCSAPACRSSNRSTPWQGASGNASTTRRPSGSRPTSAPARASPTRWSTPTSSRRWSRR